MNDIDHFLTLSLFPSHFTECIFYWDAFAEGENVIKMAAPYSKQRLTLFTMYASCVPLLSLCGGKGHSSSRMVSIIALTGSPNFANKQHGTSGSGCLKACWT